MPLASRSERQPSSDDAGGQRQQAPAQRAARSQNLLVSSTRGSVRETRRGNVWRPCSAGLVQSLEEKVLEERERDACNPEEAARRRGTRDAHRVTDSTAAAGRELTLEFY